MPYEKHIINKLCNSLLTLVCLTICCMVVAATQQPRLHVSKNYRLSPADLVEVLVSGAPEVSGTFRIRPDGTIDMPILGRIDARAKTGEELSKAIRDKLRINNIASHKVIVLIKQINSQSFFIQGAIRKPGAYQIEGPVTLLRLIKAAGGLIEGHGPAAMIVREDESGGKSRVTTSTREGEVKYRVIKVEIKTLRGGRLKEDPVLMPGDIVNIPVQR